MFARRRNAVVLRFATAFGVSFRMRLDLLVNQFVYEAVKDKALLVYGKKAVRSVVHVRDIAGAIMFALNNSELMQGQIFNVSSHDLCFSKEEIARHIQRQVCCSLKYADAKYTDGRDYQVSTQKIEALGYKTAMSLDEGISELVCAVNAAPVDGSCFNVQPG
jgi:nucleoside-diphosphate-sugar epimerase